MKKVSCIIPAYNEEKTINQVLNVVKEAKKQDVIFEVIVVSDGSLDRTAEIAQNAGIDHVIELKKNIGKGGAIIEGIKKSHGDIILLLDADLIDLEIKHIKQIIEPVVKNESDMVIGFLSDDNMQNILPHISGQRAFSKSICEQILDDKKFIKSRHHFEILINRCVKKLHLKTLFVPLVGLSHVLKAKKYNFFDSMLHRTRFVLGLPLMYKRHIAIISVIVIGIIGYVLFFSPIKIFSLYTPNLVSASKSENILLIAPHPDDESAAAGGYIYDATKNNANVTVVVLTNGDGNKWSAGVEEKTILPNKDDYISEGYLRMSESKSALNHLGISSDKIYFLGFPDRNLDKLFYENWDTALESQFTKWMKNNYDGVYNKGELYTGRNLTDDLKDIILKVKPDIILMPHIEDTNLDHKATYKFTKIAVDELIDREAINKPKLLAYLIHWKISSYPHPFRFKQNDPLYPPEKLRNTCEWQFYPLSKSTESIKRDAIDLYKSQLTSPNLNFLLYAFVRTNELFCEIK